ncbi:MAG: ice-binding family protein, partial [Candidatus Wallbacteria bacterium]|nr:ice-binding family protein [Candidatus Wallbacteria bacterium]
TLMQGVTPVTCDVSYTGIIATMNPQTDLAFNTKYTAEISTAVTDLAGNALAVNKIWSFTTGAAPDITAPTVSSTTPPNASTNEALNVNITASFSEAMDSDTINTATFTLKQGVTPVDCAVSYVGTIATLNPISDLAATTTYTAEITTAVTDLAGNALAVIKTWNFTTGAAPDTTAPTVILTSPVNGATGEAINATITATFSEWMEPATINSVSFTLKQGAVAVPCEVTYAGAIASLNPDSDLASSTTYTAEITVAATDLAGNALAVAKTWSFTTGAAIAQGPAPVLLGTAGSFAILSKSGISTVPASAITGDIGVSPIAGTGITGFSLTMDSSTTFATSDQVTGKVYAANYTPPTPAKMTTAISNMETAYTDAAGRATPDTTELGAGDISGLVITPGLYKWGTGVLISTDVTLNGGPNDVWIFQISGDITIASGKKVLLAGGALPKNIFWQSFGVVEISTNAHFEGVILAKTAINLRTGATINGRLLAQTAVTLDSSTVVQPAP